ncbi:serine acetyltransferase [Kovacikia minuta CCNUW1]|uniref:serine acetyltransferase n=1 Tax=Kovacikia minuta TaxID=2931930 RepID=UPI001CC9071C|nr:DapH/DapD/GlmU-related protein [Kovacikia minuta]UBF27326.1 serine acetyltransferase [Kovacikia minuta CCNUW1]
MGNLIHDIFQDWDINQDTSFKSRYALSLFRLVQASRTLPNYLAWITLLLRAIYQILVEWILGIELPWDTQVGKNLKLHHGVALVVNHETVIGDNCVLRHATTIGNKTRSDGTVSVSPKIGNNVDIGSNVVIIGPITVGNNSVIGAGSVVVRDVPEGAVVVGNPARVLRILEPTHSPSVCKEELSTLELETASDGFGGLSQP